jgi:hypothetical protein
LFSITCSLFGQKVGGGHTQHISPFRNQQHTDSFFPLQLQLS